MKFLTTMILASLSLLLIGCQGENESEYYGNLIESPSGLVLVEEEHSFGWGESLCLQCHIPGNYHQSRDDRESGFDMEQIQDFVDGEEPTACQPCHGSNGVE